MKQLPIKSPAFTYLEHAFKDWLDVLGFSPSALTQWPHFLREFFHYLESQGHTQIHTIDTPMIRTYFAYLSQRKNHRRPAGLSNNYLNMHLMAIQKLFEYLRKNTDLNLPAIPITRELSDTQPITPLTIDQVRQLYEATHTYYNTPATYGLRDRAILALLYDCGLRRNEAMTLHVSDIDFHNRTLFVRKGKGGRQRLVPFSQPTAVHLMDYLYTARPQFAQWKTQPSPFFLMSRSHQSISGNFCYTRLQHIHRHAPDLKGIRIKPHLLRHSIATHLLYRGMSLEKVAQFLGHTSLESTQLYTHILQSLTSTDDSHHPSL